MWLTGSGNQPTNEGQLQDSYTGPAHIVTTAALRVSRLPNPDASGSAAAGGGQR